MTSPRCLCPRSKVRTLPGLLLSAQHTSQTSPQPCTHLFLGHLEGDGPAQVLLSDTAPAGAVVKDGNLRPDVCVIKDVAVVTHQGSAGQLTDPPSGSCAHHLTIDGYVLAGQGPRGFPGGGPSAAWGTARSSPGTLPPAAGSFCAQCWPQRAEQPGGPLLSRPCSYKALRTMNRWCCPLLLLCPHPSTPLAFRWAGKGIGTGQTEGLPGVPSQSVHCSGQGKPGR